MGWHHQEELGLCWALGEPVLLPRDPGLSKPWLAWRREVEEKPHVPC